MARQPVGVTPLADVVALKQRYDLLRFVDEAHSFGLDGDGRRGHCHQEGVIAQVDFIASTFSKATASIGGVVVMERAVSDRKRRTAP